MLIFFNQTEVKVHRFISFEDILRIYCYLSVILTDSLNSTSFNLLEEDKSRAIEI